MFLFLKLYLAHLIGDFILQFEELYRLKVRSVWGHLLHVLIHVLVSLIIIYPYWHQPSIWFFILGLGTVHFIQDVIKYTTQKKIPAYTFPLFVIDQIFHGLVVSSVMLLPVSRLVLGFDGAPWDAYYRESTWTLYLIAFVLVTFGGSYLLYNFRKNYIPGTRPDHLITPFEMSHALIERPLIAGIFLFGDSPLIWLFALLAGIPRLFFPKLRDPLDFSMSFLYSALIGLIFKTWIPH
ncbi:MAG TPA: DUF3307 domain-containing protein [Verrucomicrobiae bacterium]|jgi:hypothetical protein|nr:DUF3307 domain-containing protein [Verrucomicrobiae bacterium]